MLGGIRAASSLRQVISRNAVSPHTRKGRFPESWAGLRGGHGVVERAGFAAATPVRRAGIHGANCGLTSC
jgi:hypothetical protein